MDEHRSHSRKAGCRATRSARQREASDAACHGDQRFGLPEAAVLSKRNFDEAKAALAPVIATAPIEVTIVGDVDENAAIAAVASTFGALPERKLSDSVAPALRKVSFRSDRSPILLTHEGPQDKALVESVWPTTDDSNFREAVGVEVLKDVLDLMLTESVREKLGDSYGVSLAEQHVGNLPGLRLSFGRGCGRPRQDRRGPEGDHRRGRRAPQQAGQRRSARPREKPGARQG